MLISRKRSSLASILPSLFIGSPDTIMEKVDSMKYLGVYISSDLSWSVHIDIITSKARRTLGFIHRKLYRYVDSSVLTRQQDCIPPWFTQCLNIVVRCGICIFVKTSTNLSLNKDLHAKSAPCKNCSASYSDQLHILNLPTTLDRRLFLKLCTMYKILNNTFSFPENIINLRSRFQTHLMSTCYVSTNTLYIHTNSFMNSFVPSTSTLWNGLPNLSSHVCLLLAGSRTT